MVGNRCQKHIDFSEKERRNAKRNEDYMKTGDHKIRMSAG